MPIKRLAILQSSYIPWKGYFDLINLVDEFILYDDRQYTKRDWRNRNRIKTGNGTRWLTIPVLVKGRYTQRIDQVEVRDPGWAVRHWETLAQSYSRAPYFKVHADGFERLYLECCATLVHLSEINRLFIEHVCRYLGITTRISSTGDYSVEASTRTGNLVALCQASGATRYLSGPSAREYIDVAEFERAGITLEYMDYSGYREYPQLHPPFEHQVSVLDLLFSTGPDAPRFMKSFG